MKLTIEPTGHIVSLAPFCGTTRGSTLARIWRGESERGVRCLVLVARIAVAEDGDRTEFERNLVETSRRSEP